MRKLLGKQKVRWCELCNGEASLYCSADSAYLCWSCDRRVHSANFLVARHLRRLACSACLSLSDPTLSLTGPGSGDPIHPLCRSCRPDDHSPSSSSSDSSCVSDSDAQPPPPPRTRTRRG